MTTYTQLPYVFDLLYDIKSVEMLHAHLTGATRLPVSSTDAEIVETMLEHNIDLPPGYDKAQMLLTDLHASLRQALTDIFERAKQHQGGDTTAMDSRWVLQHSGQALARQPGLTDAERKAFEDPSSLR